jgi:hypothetical protein
MKGGWGFVARDHQGEAVIAGAGRIAAVPDVLTAEASSCAKALQAKGSKFQRNFGRISRNSVISVVAERKLRNFVVL